MKTDVLIIGAGPAGCSTALFLYKAGFSCVLADKSTFPRDKICGDALSGKVVEVMKQLDTGLHAEMTMNPQFLPSWGVVFTAPGGQSLHVPFSSNRSSRTLPPGFIARRSEFDNYLFEKVKQCGSVQLLLQNEFRDYKRDEAGFIATSRQGEVVHARIVVAADGAYSAFSKEVAGLSVAPSHHCFGLRSYWNGVGGMNSDNFIELHFIEKILPGYFWIFPLPNGEVNVGIGMRADMMQRKKINLKKALEEIVHTHPSFAPRFRNAKQLGDVKQWSLPLGSRRMQVSGDNFLLTGDAAQIIDPFTGEGIGNAMLSGKIAADVVIAAFGSNNLSAGFLKQYDERLFQRLGSELALSYRLQQLVNYPSLFNFIVKKAANNALLTSTISAMFEDINARARLSNPLFWIRLLFS